MRKSMARIMSNAGWSDSLPGQDIPPPAAIQRCPEKDLACLQDLHLLRLLGAPLPELGRPIELHKLLPWPVSTHVSPDAHACILHMQHVIIASVMWYPDNAHQPQVRRTD